MTRIATICLVALLTACAAAPVSAAVASSMTMTAPASTAIDADAQLTFAGSVDDDAPAGEADLSAYGQLAGSDCAATRFEERMRGSVVRLVDAFLGSGPFLLNATTRFTTPGRWIVCAYLQTLSSDAAPAASTARAFVSVVAPLAYRVSAPAKQRLRTGKVKLRVTCNQPCRLKASGKVGRYGLKGTTRSGGTKATTLTLKLSKANLKKLRKLLKTKKSVSAKLTVVATVGGAKKTTKRTIKITK